MSEEQQDWPAFLEWDSEYFSLGYADLNEDSRVKIR